MGLTFLMHGQSLHVADGGAIFISKETVFTTSDNLVGHHANGVFSVGAGFDWVSAGVSEYVDGSMSVIGAGTTTLHIGDGGVYSPMTIETANLDDDFLGTYTRSSPTDAMLNDALVGYQLSDTEYWSIQKKGGTSEGVVLSGFVADTDATYNGVMSSGTDKTVHLGGDTWNEYTDASLVGEFSYASYFSTLGLEDMEVGKFHLFPNPVKVNEPVSFEGLGDNQELHISIFDITGKLVFQKNLNKSFQLPKSGVYMIKIIRNEITYVSKLLVE